MTTCDYSNTSLSAFSFTGLVPGSQVHLVVRAHADHVGFTRKIGAPLDIYEAATPLKPQWVAGSDSSTTTSISFTMSQDSSLGVVHGWMI